MIKYNNDKLKELMRNKYIWTLVVDSSGITREVRIERFHVDTDSFDASYRSFTGSVHVFHGLPIEKYDFYTD